MHEILLNLPRPDQVEHAKIYLEEWKKIRKELELSIQGIPEERFTKPMPDKSWSASEISEHVAMTQCRFARVIPIILKGRLGGTATKNSRADYDMIENYFREHRKVKNPDAVTPIKIPGKDKSLKSLNEAMTLFENNFSGVEVSTLKSKTLEHPIFGEINLLEYTWILILHENHHTGLLRKKYS